MKDAWSVAHKEWRELLGQNSMQGRQGMLMFVAAFGVILPAMNGREWIASPVAAAAWSWVPMFLVSTVIADTFAGERERHTLETLLATRLSEAAILFGKIIAAIGYAGVLCAVSLLLGVVVVNVMYRDGGVLFYQAWVLIAMTGLGLAGAVFVAALGTLMSLRAATVRQAQQSLSGVILALFVLPVAAVRFAPDVWKQDALSTAALGAQTAIVGVIAMVAIDTALIALALARFQRARIITS